MYFISGNGAGSDWYQNALADPHVTVEFDDDVVSGLASPVEDPEERRRIGELMSAKYPWDGDASIGLTRDAWCVDVPLLRVVHDPAALPFLEIASKRAPWPGLANAQACATPTERRRTLGKLRPSRKPP